ncbi:MAG: hypothetical protein Faunusvirus14_12 [Faunusvirus sp.]|jgi:hypothetical protein|uniref:Uncharacterized protein n=1 Tax=Faunusvirus sp. TaxID=2487766 RepID=A0A3G4ZX23_9VIRU|nr:MAG: hypothetical protein Faunusvirus14_12 [Faunusvirus sp.]
MSLILYVTADYFKLPQTTLKRFNILADVLNLQLTVKKTEYDPHYIYLDGKNPPNAYTMATDTNLRPLITINNPVNDITVSAALDNLLTVMHEIDRMKQVWLDYEYNNKAPDEIYNKNKQDIMVLLKYLDKLMTDKYAAVDDKYKMFLIDEKTIILDILLAATLSDLFCNAFDEMTIKSLGCMTTWFFNMCDNAVVIKHLGQITPSHLQKYPPPDIKDIVWQSPLATDDVKDDKNIVSNKPPLTKSLLDKCKLVYNLSKWINDGKVFNSDIVWSKLKNSSYCVYTSYSAADITDYQKYIQDVLPIARPWDTNDIIEHTTTGFNQYCLGAVNVITVAENKYQLEGVWIFTQSDVPTELSDFAKHNRWYKLDIDNETDKHIIQTYLAGGSIGDTPVVFSTFVY